MYRPVSFAGFGGGLNLRDKVDTVSEQEAIDLLNVEFTKRGAVQQRPGYTKLTGSELTNRVDSLGVYYTTSGTKHFLAGCGTRVEAINNSGTIVDSETGLTSGPYTFVRYGTPNAERSYIGNGNDTLRKYDGSTITAPTATVDGTGGRAMPKAGCLAVDADSNRLFATGYATTTGGPNGATSSPSHVYISEAGDPETWLTTNTLQLSPGDGEQIMGCCAWGSYVLVFKESKFFVFYGESTDQTGQPIFNYRTVEGGIGLSSRRGLVSTKEGVFFLNRKGVYFTTGGPPQLLSSNIDPMFYGSPEIFFRSTSINQGAITTSAMTWHQERLYCAVPTGTSASNDRVLIYDTQDKWWSLYDMPASALTVFKPSSSEELIFGYSTGLKHIGRHSDSYTNDDGVAIEARWQSGWFDYQNPNVKRIRESKIWGKGSIRFGIAKDFAFPDSTQTLALSIDSDTWGDGTGTDTWGDGTGSDTWGPASAISPKLVRGVATRGTVFSTILSNNILDETFTIHRLAHHLAETRPPSVPRTEV